MTPPSALHVGEAARTAELLVAQARREGLEWDQRPIVPSRDWSGPVGQARKAVRGAAWLAGLRVAAGRHDIVHVHSATTLPHVRPVVPRFVLHCHGTDVRTAQYEPQRTAAIQAGLRDAEAVFYSTPDLAEHVLPHRADAQLLPVPVDVDELPSWTTQSDERPYVVFASRWEAVKGLEPQLETARRLVSAVGDRVDIVGLDWGPAAAEAAALGVQLRPKLDHAAYLRLLAGARAVVGQGAGILSASELEALGSGAPLAVPAPLPLYAADAPPVLGDDPAGAVDGIIDLLEGGSHDPAAGRDWVRSRHDPSVGVAAISAVYADVVARR